MQFDSKDNLIQITPGERLRLYVRRVGPDSSRTIFEAIEQKDGSILFYFHDGFTERGSNIFIAPNASGSFRVVPEKPLA
jgi:hypothetical protein